MIVAIITPHQTADIIASGYIHIFHTQILNLPTGADMAEQAHIITVGLIDHRITDRMAIAIKHAGKGPKVANRIECKTA